MALSWMCRLGFEVFEASSKRRQRRRLHGESRRRRSGHSKCLWKLANDSLSACILNSKSRRIANNRLEANELTNDSSDFVVWKHRGKSERSASYNFNIQPPGVKRSLLLLNYGVIRSRKTKAKWKRDFSDSGTWNLLKQIAQKAKCNFSHRIRQSEQSKAITNFIFLPSEYF